jgi:hypothetical protein
MGLTIVAGGVLAVGCVIAGVATPTVCAAATPASAVAPTVRIGPHLQFGATVNGRRFGATIQMACFGPTRPGRIGHPLGAQHLGVFIPEVVRTAPLGDTGARGHAIIARLVTGTGSTVALARFTRLTLTPVRSATQPLPTRARLPCDGPARVVFTPAPGGAGARPVTVDVTLVSQP